MIIEELYAGAFFAIIAVATYYINRKGLIPVFILSTMATFVFSMAFIDSAFLESNATVYQCRKDCK